MNTNDGLEQMVNRLSRMQENKQFYKELKKIQLECGSETCIGFLCKENDINTKTGEPKKKDDRHQWQMYMCGNNRVYTLQLKLAYVNHQTLESSKNSIVNSFQPISK